MNSGIRNLLLVISVLCLFILFFIVFVFGNNSAPTYEEISFDQRVWKSFYKSTDINNPRGKMFNDVRSRVLTKELGRNELIELLGEPDGVNCGNCLSYVLGSWSGLRMDYDTMDIHFDEQGKVNRVLSVQH